MKQTITSFVGIALLAVGAGSALAQTGTIEIQSETTADTGVIRAESTTTETGGDPDEPVIEGRMDSQTETSTGIEHEDIGITDPEDGQAMSKADLIESVSTTTTSGADVFIKIGDIKGESDDTKDGGNVETTWKIEEGQKATVEVSGVQVRGWDPATKEEVVGAAPTSYTEVHNETDLAFLTARAVVEDEAIEHVTLNFEKVRVDYRSRARLFGFIPVPLTQHVEADADGSGRIKVRFPWWHVLTKKDVSADAIVSAYSEASAEFDLSAVGANGDENRLQAMTFQALSNVLKASHDAAMNSIRNLK